MSVNSFKELEQHVGHNIVCIYYGRKGEEQNVSLECEDCNEVLLDFDKFED